MGGEEGAGVGDVALQFAVEEEELGGCEGGDVDRFGGHGGCLLAPGCGCGSREGGCALVDVNRSWLEG